MTKFRGRTMPLKFSSCDNALPSQYESSNRQLHLLSLISANIKTQEEA